MTTTLAVEQRTIRIRADVSQIDRNRFPAWEIIDYEVPARGRLPAYKVSWLNGMNAPDFRETIERPLGHRLNVGGPGPWLEHAGCLVVGTEGTIYSTGHNSTYTLLPTDKFARLPETRSHITSPRQPRTRMAGRMSGWSEGDVEL